MNHESNIAALKNKDHRDCFVNRMGPARLTDIKILPDGYEVQVWCNIMGHGRQDKTLKYDFNLKRIK